MWQFIIGFVVLLLFFGMIGSAVEQERDKEFREQTAEQLGKLAEQWYGKNRKD